MFYSRFLILFHSRLFRESVPSLILLIILKMCVIPLLASLSLFLSLLVCLLSWHLSFLVWVFLKCLVVCEYVLFYVMWSVLLSVNAFSFYESLLPVIMGRGVEVTTKNVMLVFWAQNSSFFLLDISCSSVPETHGHSSYNLDGLKSHFLASS